MPNKHKPTTRKGIQQKRSNLICSLPPIKTLDNKGQSNLTIALVNYIKPLLSIKIPVNFFEQFPDVAPPLVAMSRLIVGVGCPWITLRKRNNNLPPILLQCCVTLDYADWVAPRLVPCAFRQCTSHTLQNCSWFLCHRTLRCHSSVAMVGPARGELQWARNTPN